MSKTVNQDDTELLFTTMVGMVMAAIFAAGLHSDVDRTLTKLAPEGATYPFPAQTRIPAAYLTAAIGGFLLGVFFWNVLGKLRWEMIRQLMKYRDWLYNPRSTKTKAWILALQCLLPRKKFLYTFQQVLPKYPLPSLAYTCRKTLEIVEPLVSPEEFKDITREMSNFEQGDGKILHNVLQKRYESEENWVADLWDKYAYLSCRSPLWYTNFSVGGAIYRDNMQPCTLRPQCTVAANLTYHYLRFWQLVDSRTLSPLLVQDLVPICSHRYKYMFSSTRLPGHVIDRIKSYDNSKHIIVIRKGVMYRLEVFAPGTTTNQPSSLLSPCEIERKLEAIVRECDVIEHTRPNPAVFTAQDRSLWAQEREKLLLSPVNSASLHEVESAIFHLVLEDTSPKTMAEESWSSLCGDGFNRWFDKSLTVCVYGNGKGGGNVEHCTVDATLPGRALEYVYARMTYDDVTGRAWCAGAVTHDVTSDATQLTWELDDVTDQIAKCLESHVAQTQNVDLHAMKLNRGKGEIKKLRISPDSFVQMALQLAFYDLHHKTPKTYETAMTRFYKFGRTETIRTVSMHSVAFTKAMRDANATREEKVSHLQRAIKYHNRYKLDAMSGRAADRPMFGLFVASKMCGIKPKLFEIPILTAYDQLSTSQSPFVFDKEVSRGMNVYPEGGSFAPQTTDGYGVYYLFLGEDNMTVHITSYRACPDTGSEKFATALLRAMDEIKLLLGGEQ